jgi:hypothetical protein
MMKFLLNISTAKVSFTNNVVIYEYVCMYIFCTFGVILWSDYTDLNNKYIFVRNSLTARTNLRKFTISMSVCRLLVAERLV